MPTKKKPEIGEKQVSFYSTNGVSGCETFSNPGMSFQLTSAKNLKTNLNTKNNFESLKSEKKIFCWITDEQFEIDFEILVRTWPSNRSPKNIKKKRKKRKEVIKEKSENKQLAHGLPTRSQLFIKMI